MFKSYPRNQFIGLKPPFQACFARSYSISPILKSFRGTSWYTLKNGEQKTTHPPTQATRDRSGRFSFIGGDISEWTRPEFANAR
jgi:hypothetical protein